MPDIRSITNAQPNVIARTRDEGAPYGWFAVTDDYDEGHPQGHGKTELDALRDLMWAYADNIPSLSETAVDAIEAYHVQWLREQLAKMKADRLLYNETYQRGYERGYETALSQMLELFE